MRCSALQLVLIISTAVAINGCVGHDRLAFVTSTNVGLNISSLPKPTAEIDVARSEALIGPTYEDGQTLPVAASFNHEGRFWEENHIDAVFSGGNASLAIAQKKFEFDHNAVLCLREEPGRSLWDRMLLKLKIREKNKSSVRPFLFGTHTTTGLKIEWSGATAMIPDTL